ncbi:MAG: maleylpyruvate isomerase N-terminal domain-containing protein [Candidatus Nanopelagicales bacterium]
MPDASPRDLIGVLRRSHDRVAGLVRDLDEDALRAQSYDTEWTVAQVLSHLGSGATIFRLVLDAGLAGTDAPGNDVFREIWAEWDAKGPVQMRDSFLEADEAIVARLESLDDEQVATFSLPLWGMVLDIAAFVRMRLSEHAVHVWDVEVVLDPGAVVAADAVDVLVDGLGMTAGRAGRPSDPAYAVRVVTTSPARDLVVRTGDPVTLAAWAGEDVDGRIDLPAEAFLRLVTGRLDPDHTPAVEQSGERGLDDLRAAFPGF